MLILAWRRISGLATCVVLACAVGGCGSDTGPKIDAAGTWVATQGLISTTYNLNADGTCTKFMRIPPEMGQADQPVSGTWKLQDDLKLVLKWANGEETRQIIVNAGVLSFYGEGKQIYYKMPAEAQTAPSPSSPPTATTTTSADTSKTH